MALRRWAWLGGCLGVMALVAFGVYAWRAQDSEIGFTWHVVGGAGLILVLAWLWMDRVQLSQAIRSRSARQSSFALLLTAVVAAIVVSVNMLATKHDQRWDLTSNDRFALSPQSISVLQGLADPVEIHTFFRVESAELYAFKDLIDGMANHTDHLSVQHYNPILSPMEAERFQIPRDTDMIILKVGEAEQRLAMDFGEEAVLNALIQLTTTQQHTICMVEGHDEFGPDDENLSGVVVQLEKLNYIVETKNLMLEGGVPAPCEALVIADPETTWLAAELEMLAAYVVRGGQVIALLNPQGTDGLAQHFSRYGITVGRDIVFEPHPGYRPSWSNEDPTVFQIPGQTMADHPVTLPIKFKIVMPLARSVARAKTLPEGISVTELMHTSEHAWAETSLDSNSQVWPDPGADLIGNVPVAAVAVVTDPSAITVGVHTLTPEGTEPAEIVRVEGGRVMVFGDADFTTNRFLHEGNNLDLLQNAIAWMVGEEDQVSIRPNEAAQNSLSMDGVQELLLWLISILILPGLAGLGALSTWLARRKR